MQQVNVCLSNVHLPETDVLIFCIPEQNRLNFTQSAVRYLSTAVNKGSRAKA